MTHSLPVDVVLPELVRALQGERRVVLRAPTGAGKTTRVPSAILDAGLGPVVVLEPRRIAARAAGDASRRSAARGSVVRSAIKCASRIARARRLASAS
jgi:ATP-dependent helicase HrpB